MIAGDVIKTEQEYRQVEMDSSSTIKEFALDRVKYYRKYIALDKNVKDDAENSKAVLIGDLVDCFVLGDEELDEEARMSGKFFMSKCVAPPSGQMYLFVEALYSRTIECMNEAGEVGRPFASLLLDAYNDVKYDKDGKEVAFKQKKEGSFEKVVEKFEGSDAQIYYEEIRTCRPNNLKVVCVTERDNAMRIAKELRENFVTKDIINCKSSKDIEVRNQWQIEGAKIGDLEYKLMMDKVIINHIEKTIDIYDLKCTWNVEDFYHQYYLKRLTYIQAFLYWHGVSKKRKELGLHVYEVKVPKFIVCDSSNYYNPLIYTLTHEDMEEAANGFVHRDRTYKGVNEVVADLLWAKENNIWRMSRKAYLSNGIINLKS